MDVRIQRDERQFFRCIDSGGEVGLQPVAERRSVVHEVVFGWNGSIPRTRRGYEYVYPLLSQHVRRYEQNHRIFFDCGRTNEFGTKAIWFSNVQYVL